jgi:hypothetical protein
MSITALKNIDDLVLKIIRPCIKYYELLRQVWGQSIKYHKKEMTSIRLTNIVNTKES